VARHVAGEQEEPDRAGHDRHRKARPGQYRPASAQTLDVAIVQLSRSESRPRDHDLKDHRAGRQDCCGEMNGADVSERIVQGIAQ